MKSKTPDETFRTFLKNYVSMSNFRFQVFCGLDKFKSVKGNIDMLHGSKIKINETYKGSTPFHLDRWGEPLMRWDYLSVTHPSFTWTGKNGRYSRTGNAIKPSLFMCLIWNKALDHHHIGSSRLRETMLRHLVILLPPVCWAANRQSNFHSGTTGQEILNNFKYLVSSTK